MKRSAIEKLRFFVSGKDDQNSVSPVKSENLVAENLVGENLVRPTARRNLVRPSRPRPHPIYGRPKPPPPDLGLVILGVIFWPVAVAVLIFKNASANKFRP